ncbi:MAG: MotA/TolQ/ExbB proton channel family protein [Pseudomonadota bacterium]
MDNIIDLFHRGGITMYPILLCSVAAVTVFFERLWALRRGRFIPKHFADPLRREILHGSLDKVEQMCEAHKSSALGRIAGAGLVNRNRGADMIRFMIAEVGGQETAAFERYQSVLGTVASLSPLLGLFGTISGMIKAFDVISKHTVVDPPLLAGGISEALITTFAGLAVAIPAVVMDRYVQSRSNWLARELEKESVKITEALVHRFAADVLPTGDVPSARRADAA